MFCPDIYTYFFQDLSVGIYDSVVPEVDIIYGPDLYYTIGHDLHMSFAAGTV